MAELGRVLTYPRVQARWPLTQIVIEQYIGYLEAAGIRVEVQASMPAVVSDPDDDLILQTAIVGHADVLCTRDAAFRHPIVADVCTRHGIRILDDVTLMEELRRYKIAATVD